MGRNKVSLLFFRQIRRDIRVVFERDPAAKSIWEVIFCYPGFHAILFHRVAHWLYLHKRVLIPRMISQLSRFLTGIEIHPGAKIGQGFFIDHGTGVVIGETAKVGDNVKIGAGSVVLNRSIPSDTTVVGIPGRVVLHHGVPIKDDDTTTLDELPDPVNEMLKCLMHRVEYLEQRLNEEESRYNVLEIIQHHDPKKGAVPATGERESCNVRMRPDDL